MHTESSESITLRVELKLPAKMILPVQTTAAGHKVPCTGFQWTKYMDHTELTAAGVHIEWQDADGTRIPGELAIRLMNEERERREFDAAMDAPPQLAANEG